MFARVSRLTTIQNLETFCDELNRTLVRSLETYVDSLHGTAATSAQATIVARDAIEAVNLDKDCKYLEHNRSIL
jgi:hypothetical protein